MPISKQAFAKRNMAPTVSNSISVISTVVLLLSFSWLCLCHSLQTSATTYWVSQTTDPPWPEATPRQPPRNASRFVCFGSPAFFTSDVCKASRKWHTSKSQPPFTCWLRCVKFWFQNTVCWGSPQAREICVVPQEVTLCDLPGPQSRSTTV